MKATEGVLVASTSLIQIPEDAAMIDRLNRQKGMEMRNEIPLALHFSVLHNLAIRAKSTMTVGLFTKEYT